MNQIKITSLIKLQTETPYMKTRAIYTIIV